MKRENYPLKQAFANTIHWSQGSTTDNLILTIHKKYISNNNSNELLAVGKLSKPIVRTKYTDQTFVVKFDE